jgi:hypothetical protein
MLIYQRVIWKNMKHAIWIDSYRRMEIDIYKLYIDWSDRNGLARNCGTNMYRHAFYQAFPCSPLFHAVHPCGRSASNPQHPTTNTRHCLTKRLQNREIFVLFWQMVAGCSNGWCSRWYHRCSSLAVVHHQLMAAFLWADGGPWWRLQRSDFKTRWSTSSLIFQDLSGMDGENHGNGGWMTQLVAHKLPTKIIQNCLIYPYYHLVI